MIPPSGKLRDLTACVPHILETLGCRILHLLPIGPTPTTYARMGRFGSPYALLDLKGIDPALVDFDQRTTAVDQFRELAYAVHLRGGLVFLDIVVNHTGWGSRLQENRPDWFKRAPDGTFHSPGAWGVTWGDLVELDNRHPELWETTADALLTWCRRGVDGFRCDAGYMVPLPAWQYIVARVRQEFPDCVFLLEGLGGAWEATEALLTDGGMQWAYSELFQNYAPGQVSGYLDHVIRQSERVGALVHYSETHDNDRLAKQGPVWSLLRNRLCALASQCGAFGFTGGVEWLAPEKIEVHQARGMNWGAAPNLVPELARLNRLLKDHPCFFDGAQLARLSPEEAPVLALERVSQDGLDRCLVLVNLDPEAPRRLSLPAGRLGRARSGPRGSPGAGTARPGAGSGRQPHLHPGSRRQLLLGARPCPRRASRAPPTGTSGPRPAWPTATWSRCCPRRPSAPWTGGSWARWSTGTRRPSWAPCPSWTGRRPPGTSSRPWARPWPGTATAGWWPGPPRTSRASCRCPRGTGSASGTPPPSRSRSPVRAGGRCTCAPSPPPTATWRPSSLRSWPCRTARRRPSWRWTASPRRAARPRGGCASCPPSPSPPAQGSRAWRCSPTAGAPWPGCTRTWGKSPRSTTACWAPTSIPPPPATGMCSPSG